MAHTVRIANTRIQFACDAGQTVLEAAVRAGIELPYSCSKGVCNACVGDAWRTDEPNTCEQERYCQFKPQADTTILPVSWQAIDPAARKVVSMKVFRNEQVSADISVLQLRMPIGQRAKFRPGQYLQVILPDGQRRAYSIANAPHQNDLLSLHVRHVRGGLFTGILPTLSAGSVLNVELPFGNVALPKDFSTPLLCVAGGTGLAPVKSLLDDMVHQGHGRPVDLVWGGRQSQDLYLLPAISGWRQRLPGFRFIPALERDSQPIAELSGAVAGRVDDAILASFASLKSHDVYCCGAPVMVEAVRELCVDRLGLDSRRFYADAFVPAR